MPYNSRAYRILIASPSDVHEEREIAVRVIQEWNDLYSHGRGIVLLPLRWETHSAPTYGVRPQEVINRAIVDDCDLLVGLFWTRIGTPTGAAESGTLEEVARVADSGKPVMLYFSGVGIEPDKIDLPQLEKLKEFKARTYAQALTESYKSQIEFRDKFAKQLELKVRDLQKADAGTQPNPLVLMVSDGTPDYKTDATKVVKVPSVIDLHERLSRESSDVRERIQAAVSTRTESMTSTSVELAIKNIAPSGIRNLFVQMEIRASHEEVDILDPRKSGLDASVELLLSLQRHHATENHQVLAKTDLGWSFSFEWDALQPQRVRRIYPGLIVRSTKNANVAFSARVFAESFPEPLLLAAKLEVTAEAHSITLEDLIEDLEAVKKATRSDELASALRRMRSIRTAS